MSETRLTLRIDSELLERLDAYCKHHYVDKSTITRLALVKYLDRRTEQDLITEATMPDRAYHPGDIKDMEVWGGLLNGKEWVKLDSPLENIQLYEERYDAMIVKTPYETKGYTKGDYHVPHYILEIKSKSKSVN